MLNGYLLTLASLILLGGSLGDRYGRRRVFVIGIAVFTAASLLCAMAPTVEMLIVARLAAGNRRRSADPRQPRDDRGDLPPRGPARAIGAWSGLAGVATALGPLLGGYLVDAVSWRAIFMINVPIGHRCRRDGPSPRPGDAGSNRDRAAGLPGARPRGLGLAGTTYALIEAPEQGAEPLILLAAIGGVLALVGFVVAERRSSNPMLPLSIFASRQFTAANLVTFAVYAALGGFFFLFVSFLQVSLGYSAIEAGAASLPVTALMLALSARSGMLAQRIGPRIPLTVGPLGIAAGLIMLTGIEPGDSYVSSVLPGVIVFGLGLTLVVAPVTATVLAAADARHSGIASGINNAVARVAGLLAVAVLPVVAGLTGDSFYDPAAMTDGFHIGMAVSAALAVLGAIVAWLTISSEVLHAEDDESDRADYSCGVAGPSLRPGRDELPIPIGQDVTTGSTAG